MARNTAKESAATLGDEGVTPVSEGSLQTIDPELTTVGQPTEGGCAWICFGDPTTIPTDAITKMATLADFESLGDVSEDGFTISKSITANKLKNWAGSVVRTVVSAVEETVKISFIEINRPTVAKLKHGTTSVESGADGSVSHIKGGSYLGKPACIVLDELECNGMLRRTVLQAASPEAFDDEGHQMGDLIKYGMTLSLSKKNGATYHVYRAKPAE